VVWSRALIDRINSTFRRAGGLHKIRYQIAAAA
jgi:hypothetical protein